MGTLMSYYDNRENAMTQTISPSYVILTEFGTYVTSCGAYQYSYEIEPNTINSFIRVGGGETFVWTEIEGIPYGVQENIGEYTLKITAKLVVYLFVPVDK